MSIMFHALLYLFATALARPWLPTDPCPQEIKVLISSDQCTDYGRGCSDDPELRTMDAIHSALSTCPNITSLDLRLALIGCTEWPSRWNFPFAPGGGEVYPRLKLLRLEGYSFGGQEVEPWHFPQWKYGLAQWSSDVWAWLRKGQWSTWVQWKNLPKQQQTKSNFALWMDAMDASGIEELWIDRMTQEVIENLPARLTSLRTLGSTNLPFILSLPNNTLTNFTWVGPSQPHDLSTILAHQGSSLQHLEFRCPELSCPSFPAEYDVSVLLNKTDNLKYLSINVPRNGTWPLEYLEAVASISTLE